MVQRAIDIVAAALTTVLLAFGLFGSGLVVCMMPQTTQLLGNNFSGWNEATYPQDTMSELAEAVRSFSIDDTGRPQLEACVRTALEEHFPDIERTLAAGNTGQNAAGNLYAGGIGAGNLVLFKLAPDATGLEIAAYLAGGPFGIVSSMLAHRRFFTNSRQQ